MGMEAEGALEAIPRPVAVGEEMGALRRFYRDVSWTGTIAEGGMGVGSPEMTAVGRGTHQSIQGGRWIVGTYEQDQFLIDGTFVLKWQLHWVVGWDPTHGEYRATLADNYGNTGVMRGPIDGDTLIFESTHGDAPVRIRLCWEIEGPDEMTWINEMSINDCPWALVEAYRLTPA